MAACSVLAKCSLWALVLFVVITHGVQVEPDWPVAKFQSNNTVAVLNDGNIELDTGTGVNPKILLKADRVETSGDVFVQGNSKGVASQLAFLTQRLDEVTALTQRLDEATAEIEGLKRNVSQLSQGAGQTAAGSAPACLPPNGKLTNNGTHYLCICGRGSSGIRCEVPPSLSQAEPLTDSKILGTQAVQDSGHSADHGYALVVDGDVTTYWEADSSANEYITFDMQALVDIAGVAIKSPGKFDAAAPYECQLQYSGGANGPWLTALDFQPEHLYRWQYFAVPPSAATRYVRLYVRTNRGDGSNVRIAEIEFFAPNPGIRADAEPTRCMPPGGRLTYDGSGWVCACEGGWSGDTCEAPPPPPATCREVEVKFTVHVMTACDDDEVMAGLLYIQAGQASYGAIHKIKCCPIK